MSYYIVKVYGLVCARCEASEETVPPPDEPDKLAWARRQLRDDPASRWSYEGGEDLCGKCNGRRP